MNILVTGANGQLGHEIKKQSRVSDHEFCFADIQGEDLMQLDITDPEQVQQAITDDLDVIINCAAYNEVDKAEEDEQAAMKINAEAVGLLAAAAKKAACLKEGDTIKLGDVDVTTKYDKEKKVTYTNYKIFSFDVDGGNNSTPKPASNEPQPVVDDGEMEDARLPF